MALSTQVGVKKVMGGLYERTIRKKYKKQADFIIRSFQSPSYRQWIVADFGRQDFIDMYAVEGLAYEYWRVTALMRGIGKGDSFRNTGNPWISYEPDAVQAFLIHSYDERIEKVPFSYSRIGSWFHVTQNAPKTAENRIFVPFYNIERRKGGGYLETLGVTGPDFISNFLLGNIDLVAFKQAHLFIAKQFQKATGFTLDSFLSCLWALVMIALIPPEALDDVDETKALDLSVDKPLGQNLLSILQRGYRTVKNDKQQLEQDVLLFGSVARRTFPECTDEGLKAAFNYLTLQDDKRSLIGLWTSGRRFPIIPFGSIVIIDLQGIPPLLNTLFFRIQDQQGLKGTVFEDAFRAALAECGLHLTQRGVIESQTGLEREIDAGVRIGDTLVLMECRAMELPLDFEIGKPRTINARTRMMNEKVDQVLSLRDFIIQNPQGKNYDFSWAREIVALVVSPFVEWIWDRSDRLWLDAETPRIQQADEAIEYLQNMNNKARTA